MASRTQIRVSKVAQFTGHTDSVYDFAVDRERLAVYSVSADGHIVKWKLEDPENGLLVLQTDEAFFSVYLDQESDVLYAGTQKGNVYAIDLTESNLLWREKRHIGGVFFLSVWDKELLTGGEDGVLRIGRDTFQLSQHSLRTLSVREGSIWIGSSDNSVYVFDPGRKEIQYVLKGHTNSVFGLASENKDYVFSSGRDAMLRLWDAKSFQLIKEVPAHNYQVTSLAIQDGLLLSSSMDKSIRIWDADLVLLKVIDATKMECHTNCINKVKWLNERMFVSCSDDRSLRVWRIELNP